MPDANASCLKASSQRSKLPVLRQRAPASLAVVAMAKPAITAAKIVVRRIATASCNRNGTRMCQPTYLRQAAGGRWQQDLRPGMDAAERPWLDGPLSAMMRARMRPIRKAIFPVAGLGTRFLPATKAMPKEMLPVVDRPLIQHVVDEAREAGIEHFIFVTGRNKAVIEDHFDRQFELELTLKERNKLSDLELLSSDLPDPGTASFTRQQSPLGLGHAVWCARELVGPEPFALLLPDVLVQHKPGCLAQMIEAYHAAGEAANIIAVEEVPLDRIHMYGVIGKGARNGKTFAVTEMVEKPPREKAPSNLIITGRYILQPEIFTLLETQEGGAGGEIQITDAMIKLAGRQPFYALPFEGRSFDCGSKVGFLAANVAYALERPDIAPAFRAEIKRLLGE
jgi:UTP--glucose-1-phosphate uridylyltransferase